MDTALEVAHGFTSMAAQLRNPPAGGHKGSTQDTSMSRASSQGTWVNFKQKACMYMCIYTFQNTSDHPVSSCLLAVPLRLCSALRPSRLLQKLAMSLWCEHQGFVATLFVWQMLGTFSLTVIKHVCSFRNRSFRQLFRLLGNTYSTGDRKLLFLKGKSEFINSCEVTHIYLVRICNWQWLFQAVSVEKVRHLKGLNYMMYFLLRKQSFPPGNIRRNTSRKKNYNEERTQYARKLQNKIQIIYEYFLFWSK